MKSPPLTNAELAIMDLLWQNDRLMAKVVCLIQLLGCLASGKIHSALWAISMVMGILMCLLRHMAADLMNCGSMNSLQDLKYVKNHRK